MDLGAIHFHDARIIRVVEVPSTDSVFFEVMYPVDWENNVFEPRAIAFRDVLNYKVEEGPFAGEPTMLDVYDRGMVGGRRHIEIQTNAGTPSLLFGTVELLPGGSSQAAGTAGPRRP